MKTSLVIIVSLVFMGMVFTSCQKDNSLMDDLKTSEVYASSETGPVIKDGPWSSKDDPGPIGIDFITNFPDPFSRTTTIMYIVQGKTELVWVNLVVYRNKYDPVTVLVHEYQHPGEHFAKFDASELPAGKYTARVKIGSKIYEEAMTKAPFGKHENDNLASDL